MGKIQNVNIYVIFAIMAVGLLAIGSVTMQDQRLYERVNASGNDSWNVKIDKNTVSSYGKADDGMGPVIKKNEINFSLNFLNPGEYKTYTFEMVNDGDINAVLNNISVIDNSITTDGLSFTYVVYKDKNVILNSQNNIINEEYNHLYRNGGKNLIEVTVRYEPENNIMKDEIVVAKYTMKLNYNN